MIRNVNDEVFQELVAVLAFSDEAAAMLGGTPLPPRLVEFADEEAQTRGYDTWRHAITA